MIIDALRASVLGDLPEDMLGRLAEAGAPCDLAAGQRLLGEGDPPDAMYVVLEGELEIAKRVGDADVVVNVCGPGQLLGELGLLHRRPRSATVTARTPGRVLRIPGETLEEFLAHPTTARALLEAATGRLDHENLLMRQHERMATLGMLAAGLLHEVNNPAAAVQRGIRRLREVLESLEAAAGALPDAAVLESLGKALQRHEAVQLDPLARVDAEEAMRDHLEALGIDQPWELASPLVRLGLDAEAIATLLDEVPEHALDPALRWLVARGEVEQLLDEAGSGAARISDLVTSVKSYTHHDGASLGDVDVHEGLEQALTLLRHKIPDGVEIVRDYDRALPTVEGQAGDLNGVWINLIDNALDAMGEHGQLTLQTRGSDGEVVVQISNTGPPVPEEVLERVFDPFFTTKPVGQGTGLGLSTAFAVVAQQHHGKLSLDSGSGETTATVVLPRSRPHAP